MKCKFCKSFPLIFMQIDKGLGAAEHLVEEDYPRRRLSQKQEGLRPGRGPIPIRADSCLARALLLFFGRFVCRWSRRLCRVRRLRRTGHAVFEAADAFAKSLHDFRDAFTAKENQNHSQNHKPMKNTEFTHEPPPRACFVARYLNPSAGSPARQVSIAFCPYRITRSSPTRRVTCSRSRYSSRGMAYFRVMPVSSLNAGTEIRSLFVFL